MTGRWVDDANAALLTDLYELTMAAGYFKRGMNDPATFDLFIRRLPDRRNFLISCGLESALDYLEGLRFGRDSLDYLDSLKLFEEDYLEFLGELRWTGDVWAIPEGETVFASEPLVRITAPLIQAQIVESFLMNCITHQTMVASKAARIAIACGDRTFVDYSLRRDHGADAGLKGARAAYIGGASSTSNVLAGKLYEIPVSGTMAHSYVMAFPDEAAAFEAYAADFGERTVLLIDTFDVEAGARRAAEVATRLKERGVKMTGVRIDSGDLASHTRNVRKILDEAGLPELKITLSGDLEEYRIAELVSDDVPVDSFGVGTELGTSGDAPSLQGAYKLVEDASGPKIKLSAGKITSPCRKQVFRSRQGDVIGLESEDLGGRPLLEPVMSGGRRVRPPDSLDAIRDRCREAVAALAPELRSLERAAIPYPITLSDRLTELVRRMGGSAG